MLAYPAITSGRYALSASTISSTGVVTETVGAPLRPACIAAITCCERWSELGAPTPTIRVSGVIPSLANDRMQTETQWAKSCCE